MLVNCRSRLAEYDVGLGYTVVKLSKKQLRLVLLLSDNQYHDYEEAFRYVYPDDYIYNKEVRRKFTSMLSRTCARCDLDVLIKREFGIMCKTEIFLTY